jgi:hypothetical protein
VGTCEVDATRDSREGHNVISFNLEQSGAGAVRMRFPFEKDASGRVVYLRDKVSVEPAKAVVFAPGNR